MKIAFLGDTHFGVRNDSQHFHNFFEKFYSEVFFPYLIENNIDTVIQLGDLYDRRKYTSHLTASESNKYFFSKFEEYNIKLIAIIGNHDIYHKESLTVNSPELFLKSFKNIELIKEPKSIKSSVGVGMDLVPWICSENIEEIDSFIASSNSEVLIGHLELSGFKMHKTGIASQHGLEVSSFSTYEKVFSGHYHHRSNNGNIQYVGTPYEMTWADYDDPKGFEIFDTETRTSEFISNPFSIFLKVEYDDTQENSETGYLNEEFLTNFKDKYVKIQVIQKTNVHLFDLFMDQLYAQNPIDVNLIEEVEHLVIYEEAVDESEDTVTIIHKYIDKVSNQNLNTFKLKDIMTDLHNKAISSGAE